MRWFWLWLGLFYVLWLAAVLVYRLGPVVTAHWPIAAAMAAGSYFAGSTPMGGGTVGFPILVLLFDGPASLGRDFSFAIQSVGMVSASIFIWARRQPLERVLLRWSLLGTAVGTPLGLGLLAPVVPGLVAKLVFAVLWGSFGLLHLARLKEICSFDGLTDVGRRFERRVGLAVGLVGGATVASLTGVGVDMMLYAVLILLARADLKIAIPTSVILMAATSVVGIATRGLLTALAPGTYAPSPDLFGHWLAAAPVVAVGAPLGAWIVALVGRRPTLVVVSALGLVQFAWTCAHEWELLGYGGLAAALAALAAATAALAWMARTGERLALRRRHLDAPPTPAGGGSAAIGSPASPE